MADRRDVALAMLGAVESAHFYSAALPSIMTIRKFVDDDESLQAIRQGETIATGMSLALGWILSELTDSYLPLVMAMGMAVVMITMYEFAVRGKMDAGTVRSAAGLAAESMIPGYVGGE